MVDFEFRPGQFLVNVHDPMLCEGRGCVVHHPSDHHMVTWTLNWRAGYGTDPWTIKPAHFERLCPKHGIGHPDPDDIAYQYEILGESQSISVHGCCGCCKPKPRRLLCNAPRADAA